MNHTPPHALRTVLRRAGILLAAVALVAGCASAPAPTPGIALDVDDPTPSAIRGETIQVVVELTRLGGANAPVALSVTGLPANVAAAFAPAALAGGATESTLTLTVDAAAAEGMADLTVTGTAGSLTDDVDLTLAVSSLTVTGRVEQALRQPLIGAAVESQEATAFTDATGAFTLSGLSIPYDLVVSSAAGSGGLHVYEGMTSTTPLLRPAFAIFGFTAPGFGATVDGSLGGGALGANERVVVCLAGLAVAVYGCDTRGSGATVYSINAAWLATPAVSVRLHALRFEVDADDVPTAYLGYETILLDLTDAGASLADLVFEPVDADTLTGTASHPASLPDTTLLVMARFGPNLSIPLVSVEDPADAFGVLVPVLPGLSYDVLFSATDSGESVVTWRHDVDLTAGDFAVSATTQLVAPADAATGIVATTPFTSTAVGGARTFLWDPLGAGPSLGLTTMRASVAVPDPELGGFAFPDGASYAWTVIGHGDDGVDVAAAGGFADFFQLLYAFSMGGPGLDGDRTFAPAGEERDFTFAP